MEHGLVSTEAVSPCTSRAFEGVVVQSRAMNRQSVVLAALAPGGSGSFSPVQVQKILFLLDRNASGQLGGPHFDFRPYDYGPFDSSVYREIEKLASSGFAVIDPTGPYKTYRLTDAGEAEGRRVLDSLAPEIRDYIERVVAFVRGSSFSRLVSSIYEAYPEMAANSVFKRP